MWWYPLQDQGMLFALHSLYVVPSVCGGMPARAWWRRLIDHDHRSISSTSPRDACSRPHHVKNEELRSFILFGDRVLTSLSPADSL